LSFERFINVKTCDCVVATSQLVCYCLGSLWAVFFVLLWVAFVQDGVGGSGGRLKSKSKPSFDPNARVWVTIYTEFRSQSAPGFCSTNWEASVSGMILGEVGPAQREALH